MIREWARPVSHDDIYPRDALHRYRIYAVTGTGSRPEDLRVLATAETPGGVGTALVQMHADAKEVGRRLADEGRIGVLDVLGGDGAAGDWIVLPFDRGR